MRSHAFKVVVAAAATLVIWTGGPTNDTVGAARDGGARSRVVGRGDIVTSILGWQDSPQGRRRTRSARCRWQTFTDAQLEWLIAAAAELVKLGHENPLLDSLRRHLGTGELPDGDLQGRTCSGAVTEFRFVPYQQPRTTQQVLMRQMITRLPAPDPVATPPMGTAVPVGQPVFFSVTEQSWQPIQTSLTLDGVTAEVRARPTGLRVIAGDPEVAPVSCDGPGRPFDRFHPSSADLQAGLPDSCAVRYSTTSAGLGSARSPRPASVEQVRPPSWIGTVTVLWHAEWRTGDGPWTPLGTIARTRLVDRAVRELTTSLESGPP